ANGVVIERVFVLDFFRALERHLTGSIAKPFSRDLTRKSTNWSPKEAATLGFFSDQLSSVLISGEILRFPITRDYPITRSPAHSRPGHKLPRLRGHLYPLTLLNKKRHADFQSGFQSGGFGVRLPLRN